MRRLAAAAALLALVLAVPASPSSPQIYEFTIPTASSGPDGIAEGPDGNIWFTELTGDTIGRMTPGGEFTEFPLPTPGASPGGIAAGPDGALWFTEQNVSVNKIGRVTTAGSFSEFPIPTGSVPHFITAGPDGAVGCVNSIALQIARFRTPAEFAHPTRCEAPARAAGDRRSGASRVGRDCRLEIVSR